MSKTNMDGNNYLEKKIYYKANIYYMQSLIINATKQ